jgi:hypothetical protein
VTDATATLKHRQNIRSVLVEHKRLTPGPEPNNVFFDVRRFRPGVAHLRALGDRPHAEFLLEVCDAHDIEPLDMLQRLDRWRERLTPELVRAAGADRWPPALAVLRGGRRGAR